MGAKHGAERNRKTWKEEREYPTSAASASRSSFHVFRLRSAPCFAPIGRSKPTGSSCPLSSLIVVSNVHIRPSFRRMWPKPRETPVSNCIQLSVIPFASDASSPSAIFQFDGFVSASPPLEHVANLFLALHCLDVPGEGHEVAPVTVRLK